jgi:mono/diheme cytochrome c family protein
VRSRKGAVGSTENIRRSAAATTHWHQRLGCWALIGVVAFATSAAAHDQKLAGKFYRVIDSKVDARTYDGFRRFHAGCSHCHGQDGMGSTFGPALVERLPDVERFRRVVRQGAISGSSVMKGYADDPNFAPYLDDIYAYLQARADGVLGRGRPDKLEE